MELNVNAKSLNDFLSRVNIGEVKEISFLCKDNKLHILTNDTDQLLAVGFLNVKSDFSFNFNIPSIESFLKLVALCDNEDISLSINHDEDVLTITSPSQRITTEVIKTDLFERISKAISIADVGNEIQLTQRGDTNSYSDSIKTEGKTFGKYLKACSTINCYSYNFTQESDVLYVASDMKRESIKIKMPLKEKFKSDKKFWLSKLVRDVFQCNPDSLDIFINSYSDPLIIRSKSEEHCLLICVSPGHES